MKNVIIHMSCNKKVDSISNDELVSALNHAAWSVPEGFNITHLYIETFDAEEEDFKMPTEDDI